MALCTSMSPPPDGVFVRTPRIARTEHTYRACPTCATSTTLPCQPNASCSCPRRATCLSGAHCSSFAHCQMSVVFLTAISNENRKLSHTTPEDAKDTTGRHASNTCTPHELLPNWDNTSAGSWNWPVSHDSYHRIPSQSVTKHTGCSELPLMVECVNCTIQSEISVLWKVIQNSLQNKSSAQGKDWL